MRIKRLIARILGYTIFFGLIGSVLALIGFVSGYWYMPFVILFSSFAFVALLAWIQINWNAK